MIGMRTFVLACAVLSACAEPPEAEELESSEPREPALEPVSEPEQAAPAWPAPTIARTAQRASSTHRLSITLPAERARARVEVRAVGGPTLASCERGRLVPSAIEDGVVRTEAIAPNESATVCVYDDAGELRAIARSRGFRSVPFVIVSRDRAGTFVDQSLAPLDDDALAIVYVAVPEDTRRSARDCFTEAAAGPNDDPPQHCVFDCGGGRALAEIPRALIDRVIASDAYQAASDHDELLYSDSISLRVPVDLGAGEGVVACVRTRSGALETAHALPASPMEPWYECAFDTPSGCAGGAGSLDEPRAGDVLAGASAHGALVEARVRSARMRRGPQLEITMGSTTLEVLADDLVRTESGADVRADALDVGTRLARIGGALAITAIEPREEARRLRLDLEGAPYSVRNGFLVRDAGEPSDSGARPLAPPAFVVDQGRGDCSVEVRWAASRTRNEVALSLRAASGPRFGRAGAECGPALATLDEGTLAAIASIHPRAEIAVQLFGAGVECGGTYLVSRCEGGASSGPALFARASVACLPAGTLVATPSGTRAIEKLRRGDSVVSFDARRGLVQASVIGLTTHRDRALLELVLDDGTRLEATPDHVLLAGEEREERRAAGLRAGDLLTVHTGEGLALHAIVSIVPSRRADVYELRVTAPDTYFAGGVLVHNY